MNKQIRRLAVALIVCFTILFVQLNVIQVVKADDYNTRSDNTRAVVRDFSRPRGRIVSADGVVLAQSVPSGDKFKYQRQYPHGRPVRRGHRLLLVPVRHRRRREAVQRRPLRPHRQPAGAGPAQLPRRAAQRRRRHAHRARRHPEGRQAGARRTARARVVALDPRTGAILALWSYPSYDPNLLASHDFKAVTAARAALLADPRNPLLGETLPGALLPRLDVQDRHDDGRARHRHRHAGDRLPPDQELPAAAARPTRSRTTAARRAAATCSRCSAAAATPPSPRWAWTPVRRAWWPTAEEFGFNQTPPIDLPRPAPELLPAGRGLRPRHAEAGPDRLRPERRAGHAAATWR